MLKNRWVLLVACLLEAGLLVYMLYKMGDVQQRILMVQGQFAYRYADLHAEWLQAAMALSMLALALPFTLYFLWRAWKKQL